MLKVELRTSKHDLWIVFNDLRSELEALESLNVSDPVEVLVDSGVRQLILDRVSRLPQLRGSNLDIMVYQGYPVDLSGAIKIFIANKEITDVLGEYVYARVFIEDRKEYEPNLFNILPQFDGQNPMIP